MPIILKTFYVSFNIVISTSKVFFIYMKLENEAHAKLDNYCFRIYSPKLDNWDFI